MIKTNVVLTLIVGAALVWIVREYAHPEWGVMQVVGLALMTAGFVLWTTARFQLGKSLAVTAQAKHLVTHGLYSKIRNPIYIFGSSVIAGLILAVGRPIWLLVFVMIIPMQLWRAKKESQVLEAKFGEEYRSYRANTWF